MSILRLALFVLMLFLAQIFLGALIVIAVGDDNLNAIAIVPSVAHFILAVCVFAWMSWISPVRPFVSAFIVGFTAKLLDVIATTLIIDYIVWDPIVLVFDVSILCVAVLVGVNLGSKLKRNRAESSLTE